MAYTIWHIECNARNAASTLPMSDKPKVGLDRSKTGRAKGTVNKTTAELKNMILGALSDVGGQAYLARQAEENPGASMGLIGVYCPKT